MPEVIKIEDATTLVPTKKFEYAHWPFEDFNPVQSKIFEVFAGDHNIAVAAATSAGKTVVAEMIMSYEIQKRGGKAIYVGPLKALAKEKEDDWTDPKHHFAKYDIQIVTGDFRLTQARIAEIDRSNIIVMTPEMLASRSRNHESDKSSFLKGVGTVCFDESHLLTVPGRGDHIEVALMKLLTINPNIRIVLLSATMPNVDEICGWISEMSGRSTYFLESDYRPCPLSIHYEEYYDGDRNYDDRELQKVAKACSIVEYYPDDKFLLFVHTKRTGKLLVENLIRCGIKSEFHSADLDLKNRLDLESRFKDDSKLKVVVATSTLAWGVNLPARRVVVVGVHRGLTEVENYDIRQMIGRSGRPKYDPRGDAYILVPESEKTLWIEKLRKNTPIRSTLLDYAGKDENPHYKTLAFHIVSEIHQGTVTTREGFHEWFNKSLAYFQSKDFDDKIIDKTIDLLEQYKAIKVDENGVYKSTSVGAIASMYYYSPFDVSDLNRNFYKLFENGKENDDYAVSLALGDVDSNKWMIVSKHEKIRMADYDKKVTEQYNRYLTQGAVKYSFAYFNMLYGKKDPLFMAVQGGLLADMDRMMQVLHTIDVKCAKGTRHEWYNNLKLRLLYGVEKELIQLVQIPNIGQVRAKRLKAKGITTTDQVASQSVASLATIMKCSTKLAEEAKNGAENIKLKNIVGL